MESKQHGFMNNFTLKIIAIISMVVDHVGYVLLDNDPICRAFGRIAFPIFCFLIVEGFFHTRNHMDYLLRLCIFAILSEVPFDLTFFGQVVNLHHQNVFITLAIGLASIFCLEEMNNRKYYVLPLLALWGLTYFIHSDYGIGGVLLICAFYITRNSPLVRIIVCGLLLYSFYGNTELYGLIALLPISLYNGKKGPDTKMFFYWFYPVHLLIIYGLTLIL